MSKVKSSTSKVKEGSIISQRDVQSYPSAMSSGEYGVNTTSLMEDKGKIILEYQNHKIIQLKVH
jgi:hypothetical protein